eukprot:scaffold145569_cov133-Phaeocystis_antarctica.AAC.1
MAVPSPHAVSLLGVAQRYQAAVGQLQPSIASKAERRAASATARGVVRARVAAGWWGGRLAIHSRFAHHPAELRGHVEISPRMLNAEVALQHRVSLLQRTLRPALHEGEGLVDKEDSVRAERVECGVGVVEVGPAVPATTRARCGDVPVSDDGELGRWGLRAKVAHLVGGVAVV